MDNVEELTIGFGEIPIDNYLRTVGLSKNYCKQRAILYTQNTYMIDLTEVIDEHKFSFNFLNRDIFTEFESEHPRTKLLESGRDYFQSYGRNYFLKFLNYYIGDDAGYDALLPLRNRSVIHHIHPIIFDGVNELTNLIAVSDFSHKLLHQNPCEKQPEKCHMAVDYLGHLLSYQSFDRLFNKYNLSAYGENHKLAIEILKVCIEEEMKQFYSKLEKADGNKN